jgi:hypothetical protein
MWLNREGARQPVTPRRQCLLTKVEELVNPLTGQWDEELVNQNFWPMDAAVILATPIRPDFEDYPAWHFDKKRMFSVKSAYKVYVRQRDAEGGTSSGSEDGKSFWKKLWRLECVPKVKQFLWRLTHNSLLLRANLGRRGIKRDTRCVCCKRLDEDGGHLFLKCKETKEIWERMGLGELCDRMSSYEHAGAVVEEILNLKEEKKVLSSCLLWHCWLRRNKINAGEKAPSIDETIGQILFWTRESSALGRRRSCAAAEKHVGRWKVPEGDTIKINTDGAFDAETSSSG